MNSVVIKRSLDGTEMQNEDMKISSSPAILRWATLRDMQGKRFRQIFKGLEDYQSRFFSVQDRVSGAPYIWPLEPLYEWSRRVEYPFVIESLYKHSGLRVLDVGSGVTFFSLYLKQVLGMNVECLDKEPAYAERMKQVSKLMGVESTIPFHVADLTAKLPFEEHAFNAVICTSVLEHLSSDKRLLAVEELWRLVTPGGQIIITLDVSLNGEGEGLLLSEIERFRLDLERIVGPLPQLLMPLPKNLFTTQNFGYGLAPIRVGEQIVTSGQKSWVFRWRKDQLPDYGPLACVLLCAYKPF